MSTPKLIKFRGAVYRKVARPFIAPTAPVLPQPGEKLPPEQQLQLLKYSVEEWNRWYNSVDELADLRGAKLTGANLIGAKLNGAKLNGAKLNGASLTGAYLSGAYLIGTDLIGANLSGANLSGAHFSRTYLYGASYDDETVFPEGFDLQAARMIKV